MQTLQQRIAQHLNQKPQLNTLELAELLQQPEGKIICALPAEFVAVLDGTQTQTLLESISEWGEVTTIIEKQGSIFEIKGNFPHGKNGYGYYNLNMDNQDDCALHGHLNLDHISQIALVSKPFRGKESYAVVFIAANGEVVFKIYLGRDAQRQLYPQQVARFKNLIQA